MTLNIETRSIDFAMACPQAEVKTSISMQMPWGHNFSTNESQRMLCLKLLCNLYDLKDGSYNWFEYLKSGLIARGFRKLQVYHYFFIRSGTLMVVCVDDIIISGKSNEDVKLPLESLKNGVSMSTLKVDSELQKFSFADNGDNSAFLGLEIEETNNGKNLSQRHLIQRILAALGLEKSAQTSSLNSLRCALDMHAVKLLLIKYLSCTVMK